LRHDDAWVEVAKAPECRAVGTSGRAAEQIDHLRRLTSDDRDAIRLLAQSRSLRDLATEFGVSHETVRSVLRR
jgi:FixJ family two-component response regulator